MRFHQKYVDDNEGGMVLDKVTITLNESELEELKDTGKVEHKFRQNYPDYYKVVVKLSQT